MQLTDSLPAVSVERATKLTLPFLNTSPLWDLRWLFYLLPLWWLIGLEQFIGPLLLTWSMVKLLRLQNFRLRIFPTTRWLFFFLVAYFLSGFFIIESYRFMTFARSFSYNFAALCIVLIITNTCRTDRDVVAVVKAILFSYVLSIVVGVLAILDVFRPEFRAPIAYFLPGSIQEMRLVSQIIRQSFGNQSWFIWLGGRYFRVNSFALYPTHYGLALAVVIPLFLSTLAWWKSRLYKTFVLVIVGFALLNLAYSTARVAILGFVGGGTYFLYRFGFRVPWRQLLYFATFSGIVVGALLFWAGAVPQLSNLVSESVDNLLYARGTGSVNSRMAVYIVTLEGWLQRPIFGWGTERHIDGVTFPAGSHSYYLGILYKHGAVGLLAFAGLALSIWRNTDIRRVSATSVVQSSLLRYGRWMILAIAVFGFTDAIDLDAILMTTVWTIIGLLLVVGQRSYGSRPNEFTVGNSYTGR